MNNTKRYFFLLAYDGTRYHGWQKQPGVYTVQEIIEAALKTLSGTSIETTGCGRTDTGVHASGFVFHADIPGEKLSESFPLKNLNGLLPLDIRTYEAVPVSNEWHARFSATRRLYRYFIHQKGSPFHRQYASYYPYALDVDAMNVAAQLLIGEHSFTAFCKAHGADNSGICNVYAANWTINKNDGLVFNVEANRFLRNMVRAMVGTLLEVGKGKRDPQTMLDLLKEGNRSQAGASVPAKGLFLEKVSYPKPLFSIDHE